MRLVVCILPLLVSCGDKGGAREPGGQQNEPETTPPTTRPSPTPKPTPGPTVVHDAFPPQVPPAVDVLWIIDNSGSMADEQSAASATFPTFMDALVSSNLDYHIGVVSTDMADNDQSGKLTERAGVRWIDPTTPDPEAVFSAMALLGTNGSPDEQGVLAAYAAMELQPVYNAGFF